MLSPAQEVDVAAIERLPPFVYGRDGEVGIGREGVVFVGLKAQPYLNGDVGLITSPPEAETGRIGVKAYYRARGIRADQHENEVRVVSIKPANLRSIKAVRDAGLWPLPALVPTPELSVHEAMALEGAAGCYMRAWAIMRVANLPFERLGGVFGPKQRIIFNGSKRADKAAKRAGDDGADAAAADGTLGSADRVRTAAGDCLHVISESLSVGPHYFFDYREPTPVGPEAMAFLISRLSKAGRSKLDGALRPLIDAVGDDPSWAWEPMRERFTAYRNVVCTTPWWHSAASGQCIPCLHRLLDAGRDPSVFLSGYPLAQAAIAGALNGVAFCLLNGSRVNVAPEYRAYFPDGCTPLHHAANFSGARLSGTTVFDQHDSPSVHATAALSICMLASSGAELDCKDQAGFTPTVAALSLGHVAALKTLLQLGSKPWKSGLPRSVGVSVTQFAEKMIDEPPPSRATVRKMRQNMPCVRCLGPMDPPSAAPRARAAARPSCLYCNAEPPERGGAAHFFCERCNCAVCETCVETHLHGTTPSHHANRTLAARILLDAIRTGRLRHTCCNGECGKTEKESGKFPRCQRCGIARFCSKECLKAAWPRHRLACRAAADVRSADGGAADAAAAQG